MQAYKIDPKAKTITPVEYSGDYKQIAELIGEGTKYFTTVNLGGGDTLFVDDEGLLTIPEEGRAFFTIKGYSNPNLRAHPKCRGQQPLIGCAVLLGTDAEGDRHLPDSPRSGAPAKTLSGGTTNHSRDGRYTHGTVDDVRGDVEGESDGQ